jgi:predicted transcriptional regulator
LRRERLAQSVGLWLAEGDRRTRRETTLTNNQPYLIAFFHDVISKVLRPPNTPRIAVYLPQAGFPHVRPVRQARYLVYIDGRANSPYYIYRVSGVETNTKWRATVSLVCSHTSNYQFILQGFFAGEGNVKEGSHESRAVRIAQAKPHPLLETMLRHYEISFKYGGHRQYTISGRGNLEKVLALRMTCLHRPKHKRFVKMMAGYRQRHYAKQALGELVFSALVKPQSTKDLADTYQRSKSRLFQVLSNLRRTGNVQRYHVNSTYYWVRTDSRLIVVSKQKMRILNLLGKYHRVFELASILATDDKGVSRRLSELEHMGLVHREKANWHRIATPSRVMEK